MEKYAIDYIKIHKKTFLINATYNSMEELLCILDDFNIESCITSKKLNSLTIIILLNSSREQQELKELLYNNIPEGCELIIIENYSFVEIGGQFIDGSSGLVNITLDILQRNKINIEYQLMNPCRYSFLINSSNTNKIASKFIAELGVRDSMINL